MNNKTTSTLFLVLITAIWGMTFTIIKSSLTTITPLTFVGVRFLSAAIILAFALRIIRKTPFHFSPLELRAGSIIGFFLFSGYIAQTFGIKLTTASNASFITGLSVIMVPLIMRFKGQPVSIFAWVGIILSFIGVSMISLTDTLTVNPGDALVAICALLFAFQIFYVSKFSVLYSTVNLTVIQVFVCGLLTLFAAFAFEQPLSTLQTMDRAGFNGLIFCSLLGTALAYLVQNQGQKFTSAERAALIYSFEPVFGAFFAYWMAGEIMSPRAFFGATLMFIGMLITDLGPILKKRFSKDGS